MLKVERAGQPLVCDYNWTKRIRKISVVSISNIKRDIAVVTAKRLPVISRGRRYHVITGENRNGFPNCHLRVTACLVATRQSPPSCLPHDRVQLP